MALFMLAGVAFADINATAELELLGEKSDNSNCTDHCDDVRRNCYHGYGPSNPSCNANCDASYDECVENCKN